jgi:hypothetical protein
MIQVILCASGEPPHLTARLMLGATQRAFLIVAVRALG